MTALLRGPVNTRAKQMWAMAIAATVVILGCSPASSNTTDSGVPAATGTIGDQCSRMANAFCSREPQCAIPVSQTDCVAALNSQCCATAGKCASKAITPDVAIDQCVNDTSDPTVEDCNRIANTMFAPSCMRIPALM